MRFILNRRIQYGFLLLVTLIIFLVVQMTQGQFSFFDNLKMLFSMSSEYSSIVSSVFAPVSSPIDEMAQVFSRGVTITTIMVCFVGFLVLLIQRRLRDADKAILLTGVFYTAAGVAVSSLGSRAIPLIFIPISLGSLCLLRSRFRPFVKSIFLVLLILFAFVPLHGTFGASQIMFQTKGDYQTENFFLSHYDLTHPSLILAHYRVITYLQVFTNQSSLANFEVTFIIHFFQGSKNMTA